MKFRTLLLTVALWALTATFARAESPLSARWIWRAQSDEPVYNQTVVARKSFPLENPRQGTMRITADSFYRLAINGRWVNDGPSRAWPEHYQYDVLDVTQYLRSGENQIEVVARYFGVGDFHKVPKRPGLLAQLDVTSADGKITTLVSDASWQVALVKAMIANTPKVSIQMEPCELYDARLADPVEFAAAREICPANGGPWKDLHPRDVALMTRQPVAFRTFGGAKVVRSPGINFCLPAVRLMHPGLIEANGNVSGNCGMASVLESEKGSTIHTQLEGMKLAVDGKMVHGDVKLAPGKHLLLAFVRTVTGHDKEKSVRLLDPQGFRLVNPLDASHANPWCFIPLPEFSFVDTDLWWQWFAKENTKVFEPAQRYQAETDRLLREVRSVDDFKAKLADKAKLLAPEAMFVEDCSWQFVDRKVVGDAAGLVQEPSALMHETPAATVVKPSSDGDVELMYDLGQQDVGYYAFDLTAPAGTIVDIFGVEYITPDGRIQFARGNRNGMRYITREGVNRFTSLKRRSGRYVYLTLRNQQGPVSIRQFGLVESTYPVNLVGSFSCSDARLDRIWDISTYTLKLCMEDTFTDCPLYEQTHWVGDARNESLLAYPVFGATDIGRRCVRITAQSLERYPIAGCQTPSCWDTLLPAWSFLWGISAWDYYWYTDDKEFLAEVYPALILNLQGAEKRIDKHDLFAGPYWNMFDWTPIDQLHKAVLHNSLLMVGAIDAALKVADTLHDTTHVAWLRGLRGRLVGGANKLWDAQRKSYVDSMHDDGTRSKSTSQHTSFLSALYDVVEPANLPHVKRNMVDPPEKMIRIGAPFASLYLYEALEKLGMDDQIIAAIYRNYLPMLEAGATSVWESFPSGTTGSGGFPTRSHCHAWSSAPSYFLNRIVLGVRPTAPGGAAIEVSPRLSDLTWARGTVATMRGTVSVSWRLKEKTVEVTCTAPEGVAVKFVRNASLEGKKVVFNGKEI